MSFSSDNAQAPTFVSGVVYDGSGGPWTPAGSPYIVVGVVTVPAAQVLTIQPGVEVKFNGYYKMDVFGELKAMGTDTNRIVITSNMPMPSVGDWSKIRVETIGRAEIHYTDVNFGDYAIYLNASSNNNITNTIVLNNNYGLSLISSANNTIMKNNISDNSYGIELLYSNDSTIANNNISSNDNNGILLKSSSNNDIYGNNFFDDGIILEGDDVSHFNSHNISDTNSVNGKPLYYHKNCDGNFISGIPVGQLILANCTNVVVKNLQISRTEVGIEVAYSNNVNVTKNQVTDSNQGLYLFQSNQSNIVGNTFFRNEVGLHLCQSTEILAIANDVSTDPATYMAHGIHVFQSNQIAMTYNSVSEGGEGIYLQNSDGIVITHNDIVSNNGEGIRSWITVNVTITDNLIMNNDMGIRLFSLSTGYVVYHNRFMFNFFQAIDESANIWNDSYPSGGNYWSDWSPICQDLFDGPVTPQTGGGGPDGICDVQYDIDFNSIDFYPLTNLSAIVKPSEPLPPYLNNLRVITAGVNITWNLSPSINVNAYDIYGGPTQTSIDFSAPLYCTPGEGAPAARWWAQFPFDIMGNPEYYFVVRARNNTLMESSSTSNTAGYYTVNFEEGLNTISLPLEPFSPLPLDGIMTQIGATNISWLDDNDEWWTFPPTPPGIAEVGKGYVLNFTDPSSHVFTGEPGSMIMYDDGWGFPTGSLVDAMVTGVDVGLNWANLGPGVEYYVHWSTTRDGFFLGSYTILNGGMPVIGSSYVHMGAAFSSGENYYMVVPYDPVGGLNGSSTYSVGIFTMEFNGNEMFGLPLKPVWGAKSANWLVEQVPNALGIAFVENGVWKAHFKSFPEGVYDTLIELGRGYEISVFTTSRYSFIGW